MKKAVIALDADGVLLDYNTAYAKAWHKAFGVHPQERDPHAYWAMDRWSVERLEGPLWDRWKAAFDDDFWSTIPAIESALDACCQLVGNGHTLVCVSALQPQFEGARLRNLRDLGFPIERVVATGPSTSGANPKAQAVVALGAIALVDDYLPNLAGLGANVHTALITRQTHGSPNVGPALSAVASTHRHLGDFSAWWLSGLKDARH
ncbi:HAD family hydrolase [Acidovorax sp. NPDC077693]|uniref:HAD family hydrolase n=1 Tax=unclassified Acidovorax TaxID=2684926 RepID=UPI0037C6E13E